MAVERRILCSPVGSQFNVECSPCDFVTESELMNSNWTFGDTVQLLKHADYQGIRNFQQFKEKASGLMKSTLSTRYAFTFTSSPASDSADSVTVREAALTGGDPCRKVVTMSTPRHSFNSMSLVNKEGEKRSFRKKVHSVLRLFLSTRSSYQGV